MTTTKSASAIVTSIADFDQLLEVCKRHGVTTLKLGDIEFSTSVTPKVEYTREQEPDVNLIAHNTYSNF